MSKKWTKKDVESSARNSLSALGLALVSSKSKVPGAEKRYFEMLTEIRESFKNEGINDDARMHSVLALLAASMQLWNDAPYKRRKVVFDKLHELLLRKPELAV
ncbi:MAG: hypothetical protein ACRD4Q_08735 [Candidatus Acidiferrales bacterium]